MNQQHRPRPTGRQRDRTQGGRIKQGSHAPEASGGAIEITDEIKARIPEMPRGTSLFFATPEGNLQRNDPRQGELEGLRRVNKETGELKEVSNG